MKIFRFSKNRGFVGLVFLAIALVAVVIAAIASMSRESTGSSDKEASKMLAAQLMKTASDMILLTEQLSVEGDRSAESLEKYELMGKKLNISDPRFFDAQTLADIGFDPESSAPGAYLRPNMRFPGITYPTDVNSSAVILPGLKRSICTQINHLIHRDAPDAEPALSAATIDDMFSNGLIDDSAKTASNYINRAENCVKFANGYYLYYKVMATYAPKNAFSYDLRWLTEGNDPDF